MLFAIHLLLFHKVSFLLVKKLHEVKQTIGVLPSHGQSFIVGFFAVGKLSRI